VSPAAYTENLSAKTHTRGTFRTEPILPRRVAFVVLFAVAAACGQERPQARSQAAPTSQQTAAAIQQPLPEPIASFERVRQFAVRARRIAGGARMNSAAELSEKGQPEIKTLLQDELGLGSFELEQATTRRTGDSWMIDYAVRFQGIRLATASADAIVGVNNSDVLTLRARNVPTAGVDGTQSTISPESAVAIARGQSARTVGVTPDSDALEHTKPELVFEAGRTEDERAQLCWLITVSRNDDVSPHRVQYAIKAIGEPAVVRAQSLVKRDHFGKVSGVRWEGTPVQTAVEQALPFAHISRTTPAASVAADANGDYRFPGTGAATVKGALTSPYFHVVNRSPFVPQLEPSGSGSEAGAINVKFAAVHEHEIAQVSAFFWGHRARAFAGSELQASDLRGVDVRVNVEATCGSNFTAPETPSGTPVVRLFRGGPNSKDPGTVCVNRAYVDTIFHEYGHAIDWALRGFEDTFPGNAYSEGFGDAMAILFTRSDCYGRDTFGPGTCLRKADNAVEWPGTGITDEHEAGQIYSGFVFELVKALRAGMSADQAYEVARQLTMGAAARNPRSIQEAVEYTLAADDNDANRRNGTPHLAQIKTAAQQKKLWKPEWDRSK